MLSVREIIQQFDTLSADAKRIAIEDYVHSSPYVDDALSVLSYFFADSDKGVRDIASSIILSQQLNCTSTDKVRSIIPLLSHSRIDVRNLVADALIKLGDSVATLIEPYLYHEDPEVQKISCEIITAIGSASFAAFMPPLLDSSNDNVLCAAIETIGVLRVDNTVPKLIHLFESNDATQPYVLDALGKIATKEAEEFILEQVRSENNFIQVTAINALADCSSSPNLAVKLLDILPIAPEELQPLLLHTIYAIAVRSGVKITPPTSLRGLYMNLMTSNRQEDRITGIWALQDDLTTAESDVLSRMYLLGDESEREITFTLILQSADALLLEECVRKILSKSTDYDVVESVLQNLQKNWQEISQFAGSGIGKILEESRSAFSDDHLEFLDSLLPR